MSTITLLGTTRSTSIDYRATRHMVPARSPRFSLLAAYVGLWMTALANSTGVL